MDNFIVAFCIGLFGVGVICILGIAAEIIVGAP
jgi:hypothetical protein